ncbi:MAG: SGNH/GDSL hydrolase family protein [Gemmataceae bacterium]
MSMPPLLLTAALFAGPGAAAEAKDFALQDGDTVVFLGDSITAARTYGKLIENYTLLRFPDRKVRFVNAGRGGDTAAGGLKRLEADVFAHKPTVLTVAYGVNDIGWGTRADEAHKKAYLDGVRGIAEACRKRGVRVFICSAAATGEDPTKAEGGFLQKMCDEGMALSRSLGGKSIDVQRSMREAQRKIQAANKGQPDRSKHDSLHVADGVHLNDLGQLAMAFAILKGLGAPADVSSVEIDAAGAKLTRADGCKVTGLGVTKEGLEFTRLDGGLPFNYGLFYPLHYRYVPVHDGLNRYLLKVTGLADGKYDVSAGGKGLGVYTAAQLAAGVNLAFATADPWQPGGPWAAQANVLKSLTDARHEVGQADVHARLDLPGSPGAAQLGKQAADLDGRIVEMQRTVARPQRYVFSIRRQAPAEGKGEGRPDEMLPVRAVLTPRPDKGDGEPPLREGYAEIRVVDAATGRGVPLVELETVNNVRFVTDNAGRVAFREPGLVGRQLYFGVRSHGYEVKKDGFGFAGVRVTPQVGRVAEIKVSRRNVADRLCRLTGEGRYRDTLLLGHKPPLPAPPHPGLVSGQDSVQAVPYRGELYWFWGDTNRMSYPLGLFRTAGARTPLPGAGFDPADGFAFDYFVGKDGFARAMIPVAERPAGVIWIDGVCVLPDEKGADRLVAHYSRRKGLADELEHGIAVFDDGQGAFVPAKELPLGEKWRFPHGHPVVHEEGGKRWLLSANPTPNVRVPATLADVLDPSRYEAFTCAEGKEKGSPPKLDAEGKPVWRWQSALPPTGSRAESEWVQAGKLKPAHARFHPANAADPAERVLLHNGTARWNEHRKRWVLLAGQLGGKASFLGEVWYSESRQPTGPFERAVKVVTHDKQTFYNVCHHPFLDRKGGREVHFEGTYTSDFSGNPYKTPRYDYNQVLYRLDLDAAALQPAQAK